MRHSGERMKLAFSFAAAAVTPRIYHASVDSALYHTAKVAKVMV